MPRILLSHYCEHDVSYAIGRDETLGMSQSSLCRSIHAVARAQTVVGRISGWVWLFLTMEKAAVKRDSLRHRKIAGVLGFVDGPFLVIAKPKNVGPALA